jgi:hypothetical protein
MKFNKLFAAIMMVATVGFFACQPKNTPVGPGVVDPDDTTKTTPSEPVVVEDGDTMTVAQAIAYVQSLGKDVLSDKSVFVKGVISSISKVDLSYGNATFDIKDADADNKFTCFQVNYLGNSPFRSEDAIAVGDVVVVFGKVVNYKGNTPETEGKGAAYVFSQNGNTEAPAFTDPEAQVVTIAQAKEIIDGLADGATTPDWYQISCEVAKLPTTADQLAQYNNVNYTIKDETGSMTAYKVYNVGNTNFHDMSEVPPVGSKLVLVGKLTLYTNKNTGAKTYEMTPCYIKEVVELGTGESQGGEQTTNDFFTAYRISLGDDVTVEAAQALKAGDAVLVESQLINFQGNTPETEAGKLVAINGDKPADAISVAEAVEICKGLEKSTSKNKITAEDGKVFKVFGIVKEVTGAYSEQYKNISFTME